MIDWLIPCERLKLGFGKIDGRKVLLLIVTTVIPNLPFGRMYVCIYSKEKDVWHIGGKKYHKNRLLVLCNYVCRLALQITNFFNQSCHALALKTSPVTMRFKERSKTKELGLKCCLCLTRMNLLWPWFQCLHRSVYYGGLVTFNICCGWYRQWSSSRAITWFCVRA